MAMACKVLRVLAALVSDVLLSPISEWLTLVDSLVVSVIAAATVDVAAVAVALAAVTVDVAAVAVAAAVVVMATRASGSP